MAEASGVEGDVDSGVRVVDACGRDCGGRRCGSDGCSGSCGECAADEQCTAMGACAPAVVSDAGACKPTCGARTCGQDGCGGTCGACTEGEVCGRDGRCAPRQPAARCGDGKVDEGEECDGGDRCTTECRLRPPASLAERCGDLPTDVSAECKRCLCARCPQRALACYGSEDAERDARCVALAECGNLNGCYDQRCYCGSSPLCLFPNGRCRAETELAAQSTDIEAISRCSDDPDCATYRARALGECVQRECAEVCAP